MFTQKFLRFIVYFKQLIFLLKRVFVQIRNIYLRYVKPPLSFLYFLAGILSLLILIWEIGFSYSEEIGSLVEKLVSYVIIYLVFYEILSLIFSDRDWKKRIFLRRYQLFVVFGVLLQLFFYDSIIAFILDIYGFTPREAALILLALSQVALLISNLFHLLRQLEMLRIWKVHPAFIFTGSFLLLILVGFLLLSMPKSQKRALDPLDILFTAVSAVCVTGLSTISVAQDLSRTGQIILLVLIQLGGLGLMTLTAFFSYFLAGQISLKERLALKDLFSEASLLKIKYLVKDIALVTFFCEAVGTVFLFLTEKEPLPIQEKFFYSIFHAISAFCNAGFSIYDTSLSRYSQNSYGYLATIMFLIIFGGLGFSVLSELKSMLFTRKRIRFSLMSILVITISLLLILSGTLVIYFLEKKNTLAAFSETDKWINALFLSITSRTAGFNTVETSKLTNPTILFLLFLMYIGASPTSTGGGIKTTTFGVALLSTISFLSGKNRLDVLGRTIPLATQVRALVVSISSLMVISVALFLISFFEKKEFLSLSFEVFSAFGTVGLSKGITNSLTNNGKIILCITMFIGRIGALNMLLLFVPKKDEPHFRYPEEYLMVG